MLLLLVDLKSINFNPKGEIKQAIISIKKFKVLSQLKLKLIISQQQLNHITELQLDQVVKLEIELQEEQDLFL